MISISIYLDVCMKPFYICKTAGGVGAFHLPQAKRPRHHTHGHGDGQN
jgi:hypothetical protein